MNSNDQQYQLFQEKRNALAVLVKQQIEVLQSLNMKETESTIRKLEDRILTDNFKVLVLGEFNRGKSTFINALLRQEVLPAYSTPTTAIINEVKWGNQPKAILYYKKSASASVQPPQEIPVNKIEQYVVVQDSDRKEAQENPYEKVELLWPLELCRNGVEIIDSPGLNENEVRQQVTVDYLSRVDAVLFVLSCEQLGPSISEQKMIELLRNCGHDDIFFICNRFNDIRKKEERDRVKLHGLFQFGTLTKQEKNGVFFITAVDALEGYLDNDVERIENSGIELVEKALATFLAKERGRVKIVRSEKVFRISISESRKIIPQREAMLRTDIQTLENRFVVAQESLRKLEDKQKEIVNRIAIFLSQMEKEVSEKTRSFYLEVATKVPEWSKDYKIKEPVANPLNLQNGAERVANEVLKELSDKVKNEFSTWQTSNLQPFIMCNVDTLKSDLDVRVSDFISHLDNLRFQIAFGSSVGNSSLNAVGANISPLERVLAAAGGLIFVDIGSALIGGLFGFREMLNSILPQIIALLGGWAMFGVNPAILIPVIVVAIIQGVFKMTTVNDKIKEITGDKYKEDLSNSRDKQSSKIAQEVVAKLEIFKDAVDLGLGIEIQSVRTQVNSILAEKQKGQTNVDEKIHELQLLSDKLNAIDGELNKLMREVAQM